MSAALALPYFPPPVVLEAVALVFFQNIDDLRGPSKTKALHLARVAAVLLLREHTMLSLPEISRVFGREQSFTSHNLRVGRRIVEDDPRFEQLIEQARKKLVEGLGHV